MTALRGQNSGPKGSAFDRLPYAFFRKLLLLVLLTVAVAVPPAWGQDQRRAVETDIRRALDQNEFTRAERLVAEALRREPNDPDWLLWRVELQARRGQVSAALDAVREIKRAHPVHRRSRIREAQLINQLGQLASAARAYQLCVADFPGDRDAETGLALAHLWRGKFDEAERALTAVLRRAPDHDPAFYAWLRLLAASGRVSEAWRTARERDRQNGEADGELGLILAGFARRVQAAELAESLASRPTEDPDLRRRQLNFIAMLRIQEGRHAEGLDLISAYARLELQNYEALIDVADAFAAADQREQARLFYGAAARLTPERPEAGQGLARLASREGRLTGSLRQYVDLAARNPEAMEPWLGVIRTALLLDDVNTARQGLDRAWAVAPGSAFLHREELLLALHTADTELFKSKLEQYRKDQPRDRTPQVWDIRRRLAAGEAIEATATSGLLDALAPGTAALMLRIPVAQGESIHQALVKATNAPDPELAMPVVRALARELAFLGQRTAANELAASLPPDLRLEVEVLAAGWWAYLSTPWGYRGELKQDFDGQALTVWLAGEIQRRTRTIQVETESPAWEEWLLLRAHWHQRWGDRSMSVEAASDLSDSLGRFAANWSSEPDAVQIAEAWRLSEAELPPALDTFPLLISRARWRQYRNAHSESAALFRRIEGEYPLATEPVHRQAVVLRSMGRWSDAVRVLQQSGGRNPPLPHVRLELAGLFRRLGRWDEAHGQLRQLEKEGFAEPEYFLEQARFAEARGLPHESRQWIENGLATHPEALSLRAYEADWLLRQGELQRLAERLEVNPVPAWIEPELVAAAVPYLGTNRLAEITESTKWLFTWRWLPWERLNGHSVAALVRKADQATVAGDVEAAVVAIQPALAVRIPDSDLWLKAGRLFDMTRRFEESRSAYERAAQLGFGRFDAVVSELAQRSRLSPLATAREFARHLEERPDDWTLRAGLVLALIRAGEVAAADRALAPLVEGDPYDPEIRTLAAQVKAAMGSVRQARSLYESVLRQDPMSPDTRAARWILTETGEFGSAVAYEYSPRSDTTGTGGELDPWQEAALSAWWRKPRTQTITGEYRWYSRDDGEAQQLLFEWTRGIDRDWIVRLYGGPAISGDSIPQWRIGAGAQYRFSDELFGGLDGHYLDYTDLTVWQLVPGVTWRWHPRGTLEGRVYLAQNQLDSGTDNQSVTWALRSSWQIGRDSLLGLTYAQGDENSVDPVRDLVGNDSLQSIGINLRLGLRNGWVVQPAYRYERHERFDMHVFGLSLIYSR